jgi:hypothetical protein
MEHETTALLLLAERARLFDHRGNRGSEVEHGIRAWLNERVGPEYVVSSGEIIDSYDTDADIDSKQQDGVVHINNAEARRLLLPSGFRLIPIETVAAVVEVKLSLTKEGFLEADEAATQTARLKLSVKRQSLGHPGAGGAFMNGREVQKFNEERSEKGVPISDPLLRPRTTFAIIGVEGPAKVDTLAEWLRESKTIDTIACLRGGCAWGYTKGAAEGFCWVAQREDALLAFANCIRGAIMSHQHSSAEYVMIGSRYDEIRALTFWDNFGYEHPPLYTPTADEVNLRAQLFPGKTWRQ